MGKQHDQKEREEVIAKLKELVLSYFDRAREFGIPVRRIYEHNQKRNRADRQVEVSLSSQSSLPEEGQQLIIDDRSLHPDHGLKCIEDLLKGDHLLVVKRKQIRQVLKAHGLLDQHDSSFDHRKDNGAKGSRSFEAA